MTRTSLRILAVVAIMASASAAEASLAGDADEGLQATEWRLVAIVDHAVVTPPSGGTPTLRLGEGGGLAGSTGCNTLKSTYAVNGQSLSFGPIGTTRKYCSAAWDTERAFLSVLAKVRGYAVDGNTLVLSGGNGETLAEFEATGR